MVKTALWLFLLTSLAYLAWASQVPTSTDSYLTEGDKSRFKKILEVGYKFNDLATSNYLVFAFNSMGERITRSAEVCRFLIIKSEEPNLSLESIHYLASAWKVLNVCQPKSLALSSLLKILNPVLDKEAPSILELFYVVDSLVSFNQKIPDATVTKLVKYLQAALKKEDNVLNLGYIFHIASHLGPAGSFAFNHVQDAIVQADEVDGRYLQFEGGLSVTSLVINGIFKLSSSLKKKPPLSPVQIVKFSNYFLSRRTVQTPKGAYNLLTSIYNIAKNDFQKPASIALSDDGLIVSNKQPFIKVKVSDIVGNPLSPVPSVTVTTATKIGTDAVVADKKSFQVSPNDKTLFTFNFMDLKPEPGFYKITVAAGSIQNTVTVKVLTDVKVVYLETGIVDADQTTPPKLIRISHPKKIEQKIEADFLQKLVFRFLLKDASTDKPLKVHQAFIRLSTASADSKEKREIIFVAEQDAANLYKFDMSVKSTAKNFNYRSGDYKIELIVGDALLSNSFQWLVGTVHLKFPEAPSVDDVGKSTYKQKPNVYTKKPEIEHIFREPEKRPPVVVSNLFTGLCLSPILLLVGLWIKLGVNLSNFPFSFSAFLFHLGLGSIFVLFGIFWLHLNMFTTLRYLFVLGIITFLSGNKLLSQIALRRKNSR